ncbi:uncharacterized protein [Drosophila virilis]|uniref:Uncharacterized protein n=1 Tax=Drosophila virilis TaxID=7244 RepID=B4M4V1_DROVI|nr:uncharacterized protein LOC6632651 [Drosophila virilis]EDW59662.1 uncharacterized protein Dvir_GJ11007 [Drosophila virilis]
MWQLAFGLLSVASGIVVERNMFAYYKLPLRLLHANESTSGLYYVLQCPPKLDEGIPKPRDMPTCSVVDQYRHKTRPKSRKLQPARTKLQPLPPTTVKRSRWGWRQRRSKRHNQDQDETTALQHLGKPHRRQTLLKLSADYRNFRRGNSSKGYQHMYHRDESYNDHIFYDELQLDGKFHKQGQGKIAN